MKNNKYLKLFFTTGIIVILCVVFLLNINNISTLIELLSGQNQISITYEMPKKNNSNLDNIIQVNTPALGKHKLNKSTSQHDNYVIVNNSNLIEACKNIYNNNDKYIMIINKNDSNTENIIACLQFLAGDNYTKVKDYYVKFYEDYNLAEKYLNQSLAKMLNLNIKDVPYLNLQKSISEYLQNNGFSKQEITQIQSNLKEDYV